MVIIPALDSGLIERFDSQVGHELFAIQRAYQFCMERVKGSGFLIHSDHAGSIARAAKGGVPKDCLRYSPPQEPHIADAMLKRIVGRAYYKRITEGIVKQRRPETPLHIELERLWKAEQQEFKLSESPLYASFLSQT